MATKKALVLRSDDGTVYKIDHGDLQKYRVPDNHPQLANYKDLIQKKQDDEDICVIVATTAE